MRNTPRIATLPPEQLRTRHVENLPPIPPRHHVLFTIRLHQRRPDAIFIPQHGSKPVLARLCIMLSINPPLALNRKRRLEEE